MSWTDERVELLKKMWVDGKSASQIAKELGSVTRNAVIGKVHRLGLSSRNSNDTPATEAVVPDPVPATEIEAAPKPTEAQPETPVAGADADAGADAAREEEEATPNVVVMHGRRPIVPAGQPLPPQPSANEISPEALANVREVEKTARKLKLMELTERTCKWPIGDPATSEFWFCGLPVVAGKPYCEAHVAVAFQPMQSRRDRRR